MTEDLYYHERDCTCPLCQGEPPEWMVEDESGEQEDSGAPYPELRGLTELAQMDGAYVPGAGDIDDPAEGWLADSYHGPYDDEPNPYHGDYSEA